MADLADLLADAIAGYDGTEEVRNRDDLERYARQLGDTPREQNSRLAQLLSDTAAKASKPYRAALRNVQRWRTTGAERRTPSRAQLRKLDHLAPGLGLRGRSVDATIVGRVTVSSDTRTRTLRAVIAASSFRPVLTAYAAGDYAGAAGSFELAFRRHYGGVMVELDEVDAVELEPTRGAAT